MKTPLTATCLLAVLLPTGAASQPSEPTALDHAFATFWAADDPASAALATKGIIAAEPGFDEVHERLRAGRPYARDVETGRVDLWRKGARGPKHLYRVLVPETYDPERRYPVHFYLHGGVARPMWRKGGSWWRNYDRVESPDRISVFPASWESSMWWQRSQAENLPAILDHLKRTYNLDENAVHMIGISDGATGAWFFAFRDPTPWASFLSLIGHPAVLANRRLRVDGEMYVRNLANSSFLVINGGRDPLYPIHNVAPYLDLIRRAGAEIEFHPHPESGHDLSWWPAEADNIRAFIATHGRDPEPERVVWETETTERYNRRGWLVITELGPAAGEADLDDWNTLRPPPAIGFQPDLKSDRGVRVIKVHPDSVAAAAGLRKGDVVVERRGERNRLTFRTPEEPAASPSLTAFSHREPSGRVELVRRGNTIEVRTAGVRRYRLLLSTQSFDFDHPIEVVTHGDRSFHGRVTRDLGTLLEFAARDNDRTMLFAAQLEIEVGARKSPLVPFFKGGT